LNIFVADEVTFSHLLEKEQELELEVKLEEEKELENLCVLGITLKKVLYYILLS
jgi:hypothetical protein